MEELKELEELRSKLNAIDRLCIVYPNREEMEKDLGCTIGKNKHLGSLGNNDIHRKRSIYETLCNNVKGDGKIGIDLDTFMINYRETSKFYNHKKLRSLFFSYELKDVYNMCFNILDSQFKPKSDLLTISSRRLDGIIEELKNKRKEGSHLDPIIIVLLALDMLPSYERKTDFTLSIPDAIKRLFNFADRYLIKNNISPKDPNYQIIKLKGLKELKSLPRLYLYIILSLIVKDIERMNNPGKRYEYVKDIEKHRTMPLGEDLVSYWYNANEDENNPLFIWKFLPFKINKSYILLCYENKKSKEKVRAKAFEIQFLGSNTEGVAIVYNQLLFKEKLYNEISDNRSAQILSFYTKGKKMLKELELSVNEGYNWFDNHHFLKLKDEIVTTLNDRIRKYGETIENEIGVDVLYSNLQALKAITQNALYVEVEGRPESFYKIDRRRFDGLELVNIDDTITLTVIGGERPKKVIYVNSIDLTIDISNEEQMGKNGVLLVDSIKP